MAFTIEEINRNTSLLPGVKLGYRLMDSCDQIHTSLQSLLSLITPTKTGMSEDEGRYRTGNNTCLAGAHVSAVIGLASSSPTRAVAQILGPFSIPLVRNNSIVA